MCTDLVVLCMDPAFLLKEISKPIGKKEVVSLATQSVNSVDELIKLCLHSNYEIAFRAAWILELVAVAYPERFNEKLSEFIDVYVRLTNQSCQRHFTKILMSLTNMQARQDRLSTNDLEAIVETTFEWMIDPQTPVAVRVNCMDILFDLRDMDNWIADELRAQIEFQLQSGSAALQSRGKRVLYKLSRSQRKSK